jgi:hypothetical protein
MRRVSVFAAIVAVALVGWGAGGRVPIGVNAQDATPATEETGPPPGLAFESLSYNPITALPSAPAVAAIDRVTLDPGAALPGEADDPELTLVYVERGALTVRADAPLAVTRAAALTAALATPGATPATEEVAGSADAVLGVGDSVAIPPLSAGTLRNDGTEPAVFLAVTIAPAEPQAGTPTS